ncbi:hypothetical protein [Halioxenophilus sp. WMMB6]|uniref:hypothetical protein n=1 Tax=Halioxenophilus sp. WMMB6 TaxID=3073815 RepID=UPI00295ECB6B|nr:hypothetical protein [Halioxenophilus sp. WMMB6]
MPAAEQQCALCGSRTLLTFHHLIPRTLHRNKWFRKNFELTDMRERGIVVCRRCHSFIHRQFDEKQLGREFNTLAKLLANEAVVRHSQWSKKHRH